MKSLKICAYLLCLLLFALCFQGCDSESRTSASQDDSEDMDTGPIKSELPFDPSMLPATSDTPKYKVDFTVSNPKRAANSDTIETTVTCNPAKKLPITVRLEALEVHNKTPRWRFRVENVSSNAWEGFLRIYLISKGRPVDHADLKTNKPMEAGGGTSIDVDSSHAPVALQGDVNQYGWTYMTTKSHSTAQSGNSSSLPR